LYSFKEFVINSSDAEFKNFIWTKIDMENTMDYFIFLNLIRANDNRGKNIYLAKYKVGEPFFQVPWDLDGCWGITWSGASADSYDEMTNGLYERIMELNPGNFGGLIAQKWFDYRDDLFQKDTILNGFQKQFDFLNDDKIYERESIVYDNYSFSQADLDYMKAWTTERLGYLDTYFGRLLSSESIEASAVYFDVYPNPSQGEIQIKGIENIKNPSFKIYNALGVIVKEGVINENLISTQNITAGSYFIVIDHQARKLIIQ
jgi:spore coat protein H